jgi:hypothetical protein
LRNFKERLTRNLDLTRFPNSMPRFSIDQRFAADGAEAPGATNFSGGMVGSTA